MKHLEQKLLLLLLMLVATTWSCTSSSNVTKSDARGMDNISAFRKQILWTPQEAVENVLDFVRGIDHSKERMKKCLMIESVAPILSPLSHANDCLREGGEIVLDTALYVINF